MAEKKLENILGILGTVFDVGGKFLFGGNSNIELGMPFKMAALQHSQGRQEKELAEMLGGFPQTKSMVDLIQPTIEAGGLVNNQDLLDHPDVHALFNGQQAAGGTSPQPQAPPQQTQMQPASSVPGMPSGMLASDGGVDWGSPQMISKLGHIFGPEFAQKLILSSARGPSSTEQILQMMGMQQKLAEHETPAQRRAADLENRRIILNEQNENIDKRQKENIALQKSFLTAEQITGLGKMDSALGMIRSLPDNPPVNSQKLAAVQKVPLVGPAITSAMSPEFAQYRKQLENGLAQIAFADSGKNLTGIEKELTLGTGPNLLEDPKFFPYAKRNIESRLSFARYYNLDAMKRGGKNVDEYVSPDELEKFREFRQGLNKYGTKIFEIPEVQQRMQELGLSGLILPKKTK